VTVLKDDYGITDPDFPALLSSVLLSSAFDLWKIRCNALANGALWREAHEHAVQYIKRGLT